MQLNIIVKGLRGVSFPSTMRKMRALVLLAVWQFAFAAYLPEENMTTVGPLH